MLITLGEGDKVLYGEYYESSTNTEQELYFDLYRMYCTYLLIHYPE